MLDVGTCELGYEIRALNKVYHRGIMLIERRTLKTSGCWKDLKIFDNEYQDFNFIGTLQHTLKTIHKIKDLADLAWKSESYTLG